MKFPTGGEIIASQQAYNFAVNSSFNIRPSVRSAFGQKRALKKSSVSTLIELTLGYPAERSAKAAEKCLLTAVKAKEAAKEASDNSIISAAETAADAAYHAAQAAAAAASSMAATAALLQVEESAKQFAAHAAQASEQASNSASEALKLAKLASEFAHKTELKDK